MLLLKQTQVSLAEQGCVEGEEVLREVGAESGVGGMVAPQLSPAYHL